MQVSARYLQHLGFPALATTSADFAFSQGLPESGDDAVITRDRSLSYIASIAAAVDLPVSADFMSGYGWEPKDVAESVAQCVATGVAGLSIEDSRDNFPTSVTACERMLAPVAIVHQTLVSDAGCLGAQAGSLTFISPFAHQRLMDSASLRPSTKGDAVNALRALERRISELEHIVDAQNRELRIQFERIAQLQAEVDISRIRFITA